MCTVLLPPGDNPIAVNKYHIIYNINQGKEEKEDVQEKRGWKVYEQP